MLNSQLRQPIQGGSADSANPPRPLRHHPSNRSQFEMKAPDSTTDRRRPTPATRRRPYDDKDLLTRLYVDRGMTIAEIARELDATSVTIQKYLKKHEIPSRGRGPRKGRRRSKAGEGNRPPQISESLRAALLAMLRAAIEAEEPTRRELLSAIERQIENA
jgi:transposase-like protein